MLCRPWNNRRARRQPPAKQIWNTYTISDESEPNEKNLAGATIARQCSARISKDGK
jgi:hypothetical protein